MELRPEWLQRSMPKKNVFSFIAPGGWRFWLMLSLIFGYSLGVVWIDDHGFPAKKILEADAVLSVSVIMGVLLVFRTNSAYDRWWEGRKLWGQLTNDLRNLSIKAKEYAVLDAAECALLASLLVGFANSVRDHLRGKVNPDNIPESLRRTPSGKSHIPLVIAGLVVGKVRGWNKAGRLSDTDLIVLDSHVKALMDICGGCERILKTPVSLSYKTMIWIGLTLYFIDLPWILVPTCDDFTIYLVLLSAYFALTIEFLAEEVEEPFGLRANDLPLDSICKGIEDSLKEVLVA